MSIMCNQCGASCDLDGGGGPSPHGLIRAAVTGAYASEELRDLNRYTFSICEACLVKLFDGFTVPPSVEDVDIRGETRRTLTWAEDRAGRLAQKEAEAEMAMWRCPTCGSKSEGMWTANNGTMKTRCEAEARHESSVPDFFIKAYKRRGLL